MNVVPTLTSRVIKYTRQKLLVIMTAVIKFFKRPSHENAYEKWLKIEPLIDARSTQPGISKQVYIVCFNYIECPYNDLVKIMDVQESMAFIESIKTSRSQIVFAPRVLAENGSAYASLEDEFDTALLQNNLIPLPIIQLIKGSKTVYRRLPIELCEQVYTESLSIKDGISIFPCMTTITVQENRDIYIHGLVPLE